MSNLKEKIKEKFSLYSFRQKILVFSGAILLVFMMVFVYAVNSKFQITDRLKGQLIGINTGDGLDIDVGNSVMYNPAGYFSVPLKFKNSASVDYSNFRITFSDVNSSLFEFVDIYPNIKFPCGFGSAPCTDKSVIEEHAFDGTLTANTTELTEIADIRFKLKAGVSAQNSTIKVANIKYAKMVDGEPVDIQFTPTNFVVTLNASAPPAPPTRLEASDLTANSFKLIWTSDAPSFSVYKGSELMGNTSNKYYDFTGLSAQSIYTVGVKAHDQYGQASSMATTSVTTIASFSISGINLTGPRPQGSTINSFYPINGSPVTATVALSPTQTGAVTYSYNWTCIVIPNSGGFCPDGRSFSSAISTDSFDFENSTLKGARWTLRVTAKNSNNEATLPFETIFEMINRPPVVTFNRVEPVSVNVQGLSQGISLDSPFYVIQDSPIKIVLNYSDEDNYDSVKAPIVAMNTSGCSATPTYISQINWSVEVNCTGTKNDNSLVTLKANGDRISINSNPKPIIPILFSLKDKEGILNPGFYHSTLKYDIIDKNDEPRLEKPSVPINFSVGGVNRYFFTAADPDHPDYGDSFSFSLSQSTGTPLPTGLKIITEGTQGGLLFEDGFPRREQAVNSFSFKVILKDRAGTGFTKEESLTGAITASNLPPVINWVGTTYTSPEDNPIVISLEGKAVDPEGGPVDWSIQSFTNPGMVQSSSISSDNKLMTVTPIANGVGATTVILVATDRDTDKKASDPISINLNWTQVKDAPVLKNDFSSKLKNENGETINIISIDEDKKVIIDFTKYEGVGLGQLFDDSDGLSGMSYNWSLQKSEPSSMLATIAESTTKNVWFINPELDKFGNLAVSFTITDEAGLSDSRKATLTWLEVNDAPRWTNWPGKDGATTNIAYAGCDYKFNLTNAITDPDNVATSITFTQMTNGAFNNAPMVNMNIISPSTFKELFWDKQYVNINYNNYVIPAGFIVAKDGTNNTASPSFSLLVQTAGCQASGVTSVSAVSPTSVKIITTDDLHSTNPNNTAIANYIIKLGSNLLSVSNAIKTDNRTITLTTANQLPGTVYDLNIGSLAFANGVTSGSIQKQFTGFSSVSGGAIGNCDNSTDGVKLNDVLLALKASTYTRERQLVLYPNIFTNCDIGDVDGQIKMDDVFSVYRKFKEQNS